MRSAMLRTLSQEAGVAGDELVLERGVHDSLEEAVGMGQRRGSGLVDGAAPPAAFGRRRAPVLAQLRVPLADDGGGDVADHERADSRVDVQVPHRPVPLAGGRLYGPLVDPRPTEIAQRGPRMHGCLPGLAHQVGLDGR